MVTDRVLDVLPRTAAPAEDGRLTVGGCALADVAAEFGTPAFVFDEQGLRDTAREYLGGGLGIAYRPQERAPSVADYAEATVKALHTHLDAGAQLIVEPGRSVVGRSGPRRPPVVLVRDGEARLAVRREECSDLLARDVPPDKPALGGLEAGQLREGTR